MVIQICPCKVVLKRRVQEHSDSWYLRCLSELAHSVYFLICLLLCCHCRAWCLLRVPARVSEEVWPQSGSIAQCEGEGEAAYFERKKHSWAAWAGEFCIIGREPLENRSDGVSRHPGALNSSAYILCRTPVPPVSRVIRALLYGLSVCLSFFLMLVFMTYNVCVCHCRFTPSDSVAHRRI